MTHKTIIQTDHAPAAVGPYSQAVQVGDFIFIAGQVPLDPATGQLVPGDIAAQTRQVMHNISKILDAAGSSLDDVVKTTIFTTDLAHFGTINTVYGSFFAAAPPARSTIQVAGLPLGAQIEVEAVAYRIP